MGTLLLGKSGVLYGTCMLGGKRGSGTVFEVVPTSSGWKEHVLHTFQGTDGAYPRGALIEDSQGILYGTTNLGGLGYGTVFSLAPPTTPGGAWTFTTLHEFNPLTGDDGQPYAGLTAGSGPVYYGTTDDSVYSLTPPASAGGAWTESVLFRFSAFPSFGGIVLDASTGVLYGTTQNGGPKGEGSVYQLTPPLSPDGTWTEIDLHDFKGTDGAEPEAGLVMSKGGVLYGTTDAGGNSSCTSGCGTVFLLKP